MCYITITYVKAYFACRKYLFVKKNKIKILIVKDPSDYRAELIRLLKNSVHFDVLPPLHDPRLVVATVKENNPDIVLLNATMAGSDGIAILSAIRNCPETRDTRVAVMTPIQDEGLINICQALGAAFTMHSSNPPAIVFHRILNLTMGDEADRNTRKEQRKAE